MTQPTNEPEETATPLTEALCARLIDQARPSHDLQEQYAQLAQAMNELSVHAASQESRAILAERERDELREMLEELLTANASPSITGFAQACEKARALLNRTKQ